MTQAESAQSHHLSVVPCKAFISSGTMHFTEAGVLIHLCLSNLTETLFEISPTSVKKKV